MTNTGFLICLIGIHFSVCWEGTTLYTVGGFAFWIGVIVASIGIILKQK